MTCLRRITLVRHGETEGESSIRYHGASDVPLSAEGRRQLRAARAKLAGLHFEAVFASPLQRAFVGAQIVAPGRRIVLEAGFAEIDFGRWEGLTAEEIEARDATLYRVWLERPAEFAFPEGESRAGFNARMKEGLDRLLACPVRTALVVCHKGSVKGITRELSGVELGPSEPELGGIVDLQRAGDGSWQPPTLCS